MIREEIKYLDQIFDYFRPLPSNFDKFKSILYLDYIKQKRDKIKGSLGEKLQFATNGDPTQIPNIRIAWDSIHEDASKTIKKLFCLFDPIYNKNIKDLPIQNHKLGFGLEAQGSILKRLKLYFLFSNNDKYQKRDKKLLCSKLFDFTNIDSKDLFDNFDEDMIQDIGIDILPNDKYHLKIYCGWYTEDTWEKGWKGPKEEIYPFLSLFKELKKNKIATHFALAHQYKDKKYNIRMDIEINKFLNETQLIKSYRKADLKDNVKKVLELRDILTILFPPKITYMVYEKRNGQYILSTYFRPTTNMKSVGRYTLSAGFKFKK